MYDKNTFCLFFLKKKFLKLLSKQIAYSEIEDL